MCIVGLVLHSENVLLVGTHCPSAEREEIKSLRPVSSNRNTASSENIPCSHYTARRAFLPVLTAPFSGASRNTSFLLPYYTFEPSLKWQFLKAATSH